jgi:glyoxylate reductase
MHFENKTIYAAGLDVFNNEPNIDERYFELDNCFTLPHIGSATHETREAMSMSMLAVKNIEAHFLKKNYPSRVV